MFVYNNNSISIFFGDKLHQFIPSQFKGTSSDHLLTQQPFIYLQKNLPLQQLFFLHQVHGTEGLTVRNTNQLTTPFSSFSHDGDFIVTNVAGIGLGIATADCLPIVFYDQINQVIAIAHAGWRGSVAGIACKVVDQMHAQFNADLNSLQIFFGPSAKECCYCVNDDFITSIKNFDFFHETLVRANKKTFFNVPLFNQLLLQKQGIPQEAFNYTYNLCTLCDASFCSFRRMNNDYRQMTVVTLM